MIVGWRTSLQKIEQALFKKLPEQNKSGQLELNVQTKAIDQWFDALPLADIRISVKSIYNVLKETNNYKIPYKKRLYFLEKIHVQVIESANYLKKLNLNRELPLDDEHQSIDTLLYKLYLQTAIGYKFVLQDLMNSHVFFLYAGKRKLMTQVIERIIRHNSLSLISNYQLYNAPPKSLWSEIHYLFLLAHQETLVNNKVFEPSLRYEKETTIKKVYLQILLISVADPYRMVQHHIHSIFEQLEEWSSLADIHKYLDSDAKDSLSIDLSRDCHPTFIAPQDNPDKEFVWTLDTSKLDYTYLIEHFDEPGNQTNKINVDLLKQLSLAWGIAPNRQHNRRPAKSKLKIAIGLNNVHYVLNGYADHESLTPIDVSEQDEIGGLSEGSQSIAQFNATTLGSTSKVNDMWGKVFTTKKSLGKKKRVSVEPQKNALPQTSPPYEPHEWDMINESVGGYCLLWEQNDSVNAKVGEIIAINHGIERKEGDWFVGSIRWIKCEGNNKVQIGVQILAPRAIAVSVEKYTHKQEGMKFRAILLPAVSELKQPKTLITPALVYETRDQILLDEYQLINEAITKVNSKVVLMDSLETSTHFSRFKYTPAEEFFGTNRKKNIT